MAALRRTRLIISWCALVTVQWIFNTAVLHAADKAPVPSADAQNAALKLVKDRGYGIPSSRYSNRGFRVTMTRGS